MQVHYHYPTQHGNLVLQDVVYSMNLSGMLTASVWRLTSSEALGNHNGISNSSRRINYSHGSLEFIFVV